MKKKAISLSLALIIALGIFAAPANAAFDAANWAIPELEKAQSYGLIPDVLKDVDYKKPITRIEFAAVSVKLYENLSGKTATPVATNPFTDTKDVEVLKAYNIGLTTGTSATAFSPNSLLTREQAATMLTRAIKAAYIPGWTLASDDSYTLNFTQPAKFADDGKINAWAKQSVYYANAKGIILGTGNNMFSPAANAARQEALTIAVRMVEKLKGEAVDYTKGEAPAPAPEPPAPPSGNNSFVGAWGYDGNGIFCPIDKTSEYIEFKSDGTLIYVNTKLGTQWNGQKYVTSNTSGLTITANYLIKGDVINCTNMLYRWYKKLDSYNTEYADEHKPDTALPYKFTNGVSRDADALTFLEINLWPNESGALNKYTRFIKPIDLGAISGVVNLPPVLPDSIAPKGLNCIFTSASGEDVYIGQTRYNAYFNCSSESQMKSMLASTFAQLRSAGFVDALGPELLFVEGTIGGKEVRVTCRFAEASSFYDIDYGVLTYEFFD